MVKQAALDILDETEKLGVLKDPLALVILASGAEKYFHEHRPPDFPRATTRGHFRVCRLNAVPFSPEGKLGELFEIPKRPFTNTTYSETGYATVGDLPGDGDGESPEEVTIFVHGWLARQRAALGRMALVQHSLERAGYAHPVVGFTWDTDQSVLEWKTAKTVATWNGPKLAQFTLDYSRRHPETDVRWMSNSLGAHPVFSALEYLDEAGHRDVVESVTVFGGTTPSEAVTVDGRYGDAIRNVAGHVHNYWTSTDRTLRQHYRLAEGTSSIGGRGAAGEAPDNYTDHREDHVTDHFSFLIPGRGCMEEVVANLDVEADPSVETTREYDGFESPD